MKMTFDEVEEIDVISPRPILEHEIGQTLASEEYLHCYEQLWQFIEENSENPEIQHYLLKRLLLVVEECCTTDTLLVFDNLVDGFRERLRGGEQ